MLRSKDGRSQIRHAAQRGRRHTLDVFVQDTLVGLQGGCGPASPPPFPLGVIHGGGVYGVLLSIYADAVTISDLHSEWKGLTDKLQAWWTGSISMNKGTILCHWLDTWPLQWVT